MSWSDFDIFGLFVIAAVVGIVYEKKRNTPDDPDGPKPHIFNAELQEVNGEFQRSIDHIAYLNGTNTTVVDIFNKLPKMTVDHIYSIRSIDEDENLVFQFSKNDEFFGYSAGQSKAIVPEEGMQPMY